MRCDDDKSSQKNSFSHKSDFRIFTVHLSNHQSAKPWKQSFQQYTIHELKPSKVIPLITGIPVNNCAQHQNMRHTGDLIKNIFPYFSEARLNLETQFQQNPSTVGQELKEMLCGCESSPSPFSDLKLFNGVEEFFCWLFEQDTDKHILRQMMISAQSRYVSYQQPPRHIVTIDVAS